MLCYPDLSCFIPLNCRYSPEHPVFKHPQTLLFPWRQRPSFTPTLNKNERFVSVYIHSCPCVVYWSATQDQARMATDPSSPCTHTHTHTHKCAYSAIWRW
jgi:hypothetical protein